MRISKRRSGAILNLTPLIDIVFLLLVFFMLTAHFVEEKTLDIDLPQSTSSDSPREERVVEVTIGRDGRLRIGDKPVELSSLEQVLREAMVLQEREGVRIRG